LNQKKQLSQRPRRKGRQRQSKKLTSLVNLLEGFLKPSAVADFQDFPPD
jgi:hypothetical protein